MTDEQGAGATPADQGATPDTSDHQDSNGAKPDEEKLGEAGQAALKRERELRDAAEKREKLLARELKGYQDADKARADAGKTESERTTERIAALERELEEERSARRDSAVRISAMTAAQRLGYRNPDLAHRLIPAGAIKFGEDGSPTNVDKLLEDIAKSDPYLVNGTSDYGGGPRGSAGSQGADMNALIRRGAGKG